MHTITNRPALKITIALALLLAAIQLTLAAPRPPAISTSGNYSEAQCLEILKSDASLTDKDAACARLKIIGTTKSVPALAALLTDEQLSHSACYALESMPAPEAGRALVSALGKTSGLIKVGIINSLGVRRETTAQPALAKALGDSDVAVATAAATALGEIASPKALGALQAASKHSAGSVHDAIEDALLRCANRLLAAGDAAKAKALFQSLYDTQKASPIQVAAYRGLLLASGNQSLPLAAKAITGKASPAQTAALQLVHDLKAPGATAAFARLLPQADAPVQVALIGGLSQRDDPSAVPAIAALVKSPAPEVRLAALSALGGLGDGTVVVLLAEAAASSTGAEQAAAREALAQLHRGQAAETLLSQLAAAKPAVQVELARALGTRGQTAAIPALLKLAQQDSASTAQAAMLALAQLADQAQLASLTQLVLAAKTDTARSQAAEALNAACQHVLTRRGRVDVEPLVKGLAAGSPEARVALLPICAGFNGPQVRAALRSAINDSNEQVRDAAMRALCDTADAELLPDLLKLACAAPKESLRTVAIRGCVRLTTQEESVKIPDSQRGETFKAILAAAPSAEQKRLVLAGLAEVPTLEALSLIEPMLAEAAVQGEAALAIIKIAPALPQAPAAAALKKVLAVVQDADGRKAATTALAKIETNGGFITAWQVAGPYRQDGKKYTALFDIPFAPETPGSKGANWRVLSNSNPEHPGVMDLRKALGNGEECVGYTRAWVQCAQAQPARLEVGSDDGVKIWLNGKVALAKNAARSLKPGSDIVDVTLNRGWNELLFKVTQHNKGWGVCARVVNPDGSLVDGMQFDAGSHLRTASVGAGNSPCAFKKVRITDQFWAEGASIGDFNHDGIPDIVSGPFWYEGPDFKKRHEIWPATTTFKRKNADGTEETVPGFEGALGVKNAYSECFLTFVYDFNNDGWPDVLVIGFPGKAAAWYENPKTADGTWQRHEIFDEVGDESPVFADITGDGKPEILCCARGCMGYIEADWSNPAARWTFHPIPNTPKGAYQKFTHGIGCGDINGDGRVDIIEKDGWWEQPASRQGDPIWTKHPFHFADAGAQMLVYDVNGDGLNDVITSLNAHGYGLAWYEQVRTNGAITFRQHMILNPDATPDRFGVCFTQPHALALADMDGDGLMDIVTGKRFWAHGKNGGDAESDGFPAVLYWFQLKRSANGQVEFIPHLVDNDSGVGTQVTVGYVSDKAHPDIVVGNKKGLFVFERQEKAAK